METAWKRETRSHARSPSEISSLMRTADGGSEFAPEYELSVAENSSLSDSVAVLISDSSFQDRHFISLLASCCVASLDRVSNFILFDIFYYQAGALIISVLFQRLRLYLY